MAMGRFGGVGRVLIGAVLLLPLVGLLAMAGGESAEAAGTVQVQVVDFDYSPNTITISAGTTVKWTNTGNQIHTVVSTDGAFVSSGDLVPNTTAKSHSFTFIEPGSYSYYCFPYHTFMIGTVIVEPAVPTATPLSQPTRRPQRTLPPPHATPRAVPPTHAIPTALPTVAGSTPTPTPLPAPVRR